MTMAHLLEIEVDITQWKGYIYIVSVSPVAHMNSRISEKKGLTSIKKKWNDLNEQKENKTMAIKMAIK